MMFDFVTDQIQNYGYYTVDGKIFLNKTEAVVAAKSDFKKIKFHYNDSILTSHNWAMEPEPEVGLEEFYRRRAQQIRDKYDYIIVLYSGGPDSTNVLNSFVKNNIFVDEIVNMNSYSQTGVVKDTIHNADYVYNVEPYLNELIAKHNLQSRITILDEVDLVKQHWKHHYKTDDWESLFGAVAAPSMFITKQVWVRYVPHLWKMVLDNKNIGIVIGADKTQLKIVNGKYATNFPDTLTTDTSLLNYNDQDLKHVNLMELFYHSPDCVNLIIKQAHVLKKFIETTNDAQLFTTTDEVKHLVSKHQRLSHCCQSKTISGHLKYDLYHKLLYPDFTSKVVTPKTSLLVTRPADNWWVKDFESADKKIFLHGLLKLSQTVDPNLSQNIGWPTTFTRPYYLE
jgi:hypothetical protein